MRYTPARGVTVIEQTEAKRARCQDCRWASFVGASPDDQEANGILHARDLGHRVTITQTITAHIARSTDRQLPKMGEQIHA